MPETGMPLRVTAKLPSLAISATRPGLGLHGAAAWFTASLRCLSHFAPLVTLVTDLVAFVALSCFRVSSQGRDFQEQPADMRLYKIRLDLASQAVNILYLYVRSNEQSFCFQVSCLMPWVPAVPGSSVGKVAAELEYASNMLVATGKLPR